jgi:hypothetical protein
MMLSGIIRVETWFLVVGHAFHDQRKPSIASNSMKSILGWSDFRCFQFSKGDFMACCVFTWEFCVFKSL